MFFYITACWSCNAITSIPLLHKPGALWHVSTPNRTTNSKPPPHRLLSPSPKAPDQNTDKPGFLLLPADPVD